MKNFLVGRRDRLLGEVEGVKVYAAAEVCFLEQADSVLDVVAHPGTGSFSLEVTRGARLVVRPFDARPRCSSRMPGGASGGALGMLPSMWQSAAGGRA